MRAIDARNYIVIGDPATRLPLEGPIASERPVIEPVEVVDPRPRVLGATGEGMPSQANLVTESLNIQNSPLAPPDRQLAFNGIDGVTGTYLLTMTIEELATLIQSESTNRERVSELRHRLSSQSSSSF